METFKTLSIILAILSACTCLMLAFKTNLLRSSNSPTSPYSFSRFQLWLWTLVILPVFVLHWGFNSSHTGLVNDDMLILLGISLGTVLSAQVVESGLSTNRGNNANNNLQTPTLTKSNGLPSNRFITDLLMDDTGQFSIVRLQHLLFMFVYVVIYLSMFFKSDLQTLPDLENTAFALMGISAGGYVLGKSAGK